MIVKEFEQGTPEWHEARLGIPTASEFKRIVTPTGKPSSARDRYIADLLAEWALGRAQGTFETDGMERGHILEHHARRLWAWETGLEPEQVGICLTDDGLIGYSPDAIIRRDGRIVGLLEIKCPLPSIHLHWMARGRVPAEHVPQVQGGLWVTGAEWIDFVSYHPDLPPFIVHERPDFTYQRALGEQLPSFLSQLTRERQQLREMGIVK